MSNPRTLDEAQATAEFAVGTGLIKNAHITSFIMDYSKLTPDVIEELLAPHVIWAIEMLIEDRKKQA